MERSTHDDRTRLRTFSLLIGMVIGSVALIILTGVASAGWAGVQQGNDVVMVAGVNKKIKGQLDRTETSSEILGQGNVFVSTDTLSASTLAAYTAAHRWIEEQHAGDMAGQTV